MFSIARAGMRFRSLMGVIPAWCTMRPRFLSDSALPTPTDEHGEWPAGQAGVESPNLQLSLYGPSGKDVMLVTAVEWVAVGDC
jgi:hypothetical protein